MKISREVKVGVISVLALVGFFWGVNYLGGKNVFKPKVTTYFTEYANIQGLNSASPVTINGFQVGKVQNITFNTDPKKKGTLVVEYSVDADIPFSKNTIAKIYSQGLMGGKALAIVPDYDGKLAQSGDYLLGDVDSDIFSDVSEKLNPLQAKLESMIVEADSLLYGLNDVLNGHTRRRLKSSIANLDQTMLNFKQTSVEVSHMVEDNRSNLTKTLQNAETLTSELGLLSKNIKSELDQAKLAETVNRLDKTVGQINTIIAGLDQGKGSMGKLLKDDVLYTNLTKASKSLDALLSDVKRRPKRYVNFSVFERKDKTIDTK